MGIKYFSFRLSYELRRKLGILKRQYPTYYTEREFISLANWRQYAKPFLFSSNIDTPFLYTDGSHCDLEKDFKRIMQGECCYFSSVWYPIGLDYDWLTNPDNGYKYDVSKHWTQVEDFSTQAGDIKYVWEKSRFSFLYTIIRYDFHFQKDNSSFVFDQILDWIKKNPLNCGPNYKCSQEISLRVLNWFFALNYYKNHSSLTEEIFQTILNSIFWQTKHIFSNIHFSRIAVRNNHAITETLTLYLIGMLFPEFPDAAKWKKKGKKWFEEEIKYQIAEDGTYLQFSMNYHRVVVQLLTWAIVLADANGEIFEEEVYRRAYLSIIFLYQCQDTITGYLPNYGPNDGALFFKLNDNDYRDYRPQLDVLHLTLTGQPLYPETYEDRLWFKTTTLSRNKRTIYPALKKKEGLLSFKNGGYYLIREKDTLTFIKCGKYKTRPAHADNLHVDIWHKGENILMDGGSYKYNTEESLRKYFNGTESHNTVMLADYDQMLKGSRFIWYHWSQAEYALISETDDYYEFEGIVSCFWYLNKKIRHKRIVRKYKNELHWLVRDSIDYKPSKLELRQLWHTQSDKLVLKSPIGTLKKSIGLTSSYYGKKEKVIQWECATLNDQIETLIQI